MQRHDEPYSSCFFILLYLGLLCLLCFFLFLLLLWQLFQEYLNSSLIVRY